MKRLMVTLVACAAMLAPLAMSSRANDAHHPGKSASAKKNTGIKTKRNKKPPAKANKTSALRLAPDPSAVNA